MITGTVVVSKYNYFNIILTTTRQCVTIILLLIKTLLTYLFTYLLNRVTANSVSQPDDDDTSVDTSFLVNMDTEHDN